MKKTMYYIWDKVAETILAVGMFANDNEAIRENKMLFRVYQPSELELRRLNGTCTANEESMMMVANYSVVKWESYKFETKAEKIKGTVEEVKETIEKHVEEGNK